MARILVVDDEAPLRGVLLRGFEREGYAVSEASDGEEALTLCRQGAPDVVVLDIFMPGKEGLGTIRDLRREFSAVKIVAMSGGGRYGLFEVLESASRFGAHRTFRKSEPWEELLATVRELLEEVEGEQRELPSPGAPAGAP